MSQTAQIRIQLSNGQEAGKTINELTAQSAKLAREIKKMEVGSADYVKATEDFKKISDRLKEVKSEAFNTQKAQSLLNSEMGQFIPFNKQIGSMAGTFSGLAGAIKGATISQRALNIAIAASGIGALVIILVKLVQAWLDTQAGMDKVTAVTRPLMAIFERLKGLAQELGGSVFKGLAQIMKGDIAEGLKTIGGGIKEAVSGFGDAVREGAKVGSQIDQLTKKIEMAEINMIKRQAELAREYKLQSEIAENTAAKEEDRRKAAQRAIEIADEEIKLQQDLIDMKIEKMKLEQSLNDTSREQNKELAQLEAERINFETQASERRTTARSKLNTVNQSIAGQEKKAHAEAMKAHEERMKALEAEAKAREEHVKKMLEEELKLREETKKTQNTMLQDIKAQKQAEFNTRMEELVRMNDAEQMMINELFFMNQVSQQERDQMLYDAQKKALEDRLALLLANGQQSSEAYQQLYMDLLRLNYDYETKQTNQTKEEEAKRKAIRDQGLAVAAGIFAGFAQLLSDNSKNRRKNLNAIKAAQVAEIGINAATEVQNIWKNANAFPVPFNTIIGVAQTAIALGRAKAAVNRVNSVQIEDQGGTFAKGGVVKGPSHEAGGVPFSVKGSKGRFEMEGNEIILSKGVYEDPILRYLASQLNVMGGGRSFALGGPVLRDRGMVNTASPSGVQAGIAQAAAPAGMDFIMMKELLIEIAQNTRETADKPPIVMTEVKDRLEQLYDVENDATF